MDNLKFCSIENQKYNEKDTIALNYIALIFRGIFI